MWLVSELRNTDVREWYTTLINARRAAVFWDEKVRWERKEFFDLNANEPNVGDLVLVKLRPQGLKKKLYLKQQGPFRVLELKMGLLSWRMSTARKM